MKLIRDKVKKDTCMASKICGMIEREDLRNDHPQQRKSGQWEEEVRDNFIVKAKITFGDTEFRLNDIVMNYANDYKAIIYNEEYIDDKNTTFIANGESGRVVKILKDAMVVDYDGTLIYIPKSSMKNIRLAYAISTHKSQGGQFKVVVLITPKAHTFMLNSNLLYVGESRAKEKCYHLGEIRTVNNALKKKENFDRKTMLQIFMKAE